MRPFESAASVGTHPPLSEYNSVYPEGLFDAATIRLGHIVGAEKTRSLGQLITGQLPDGWILEEATNRLAVHLDTSKLLIRIISGRTFSRYVLQEVIDDIETLQSINHQNLLPVLGAAVVRLTGPALWICYPFPCDAISYFEYLHGNKSGRTEWPSLMQRLRLLRSVLDCLNTLHRHEVCHGHLSSHNILLAPSLPHQEPLSEGLQAMVRTRNQLEIPIHFKGGGEVALVMDVGFHSLKRFLAIVDQYQFLSAWSAPELLSGECRRFTSQSDIYSFGMLLWEAVSGLVPFKECSITDISKIVVGKRQRPSVPVEAGQQLATLIRSCWAQNPSSRPTAATVVRALDYILENVM